MILSYDSSLMILFIFVYRKTRKAGPKKSRTSIGGSKTSSGSKEMAVNKKDRRRSDRKLKNESNKSLGTTREDQRAKSPRHGK